MQWTSAVLASALVASALSFVSADMSASPHAYKDPDSGELLFVVGGAKEHHEEDQNGYTVISDPYGTGRKVFAEEDTFTHELISSGCILGQSTPENCPGHLTKHLKETKDALLRHYGEFVNKSEDTAPNRIIEKAKMLSELERDSDSSRRLSTTAMKNLVLFVRWQDHADRPTPTTSQYEALFNQNGYAPTGSVRDVYLFNSNGQFDIDSHIYVPQGNDPEDPFIVVPYNEVDVTPQEHLIHPALKYCLDIVEADESINLADFDTFGGADSQIDAITYVHTGYAAEWGGTDQYGNDMNNRIWSHKWQFSTWTSQSTGVQVSTYNINPAMWWTSGSQITRIGVIAHELGHFLGLPDLMDGNGGLGVGNWCLMGNAWGWGGTQYHPPMMSPWAKIQLGWASPTEISTSGTYEVLASKDNGPIYKITDGYPSGEYLLIENRQTHVIDKVSQGGLVIWHIDELASNNFNEGHPAQAGWPENGNHYMNAVIQADGGFDMERQLDRGDKKDTFRAGGTEAYEIGPNGIVKPEGNSIPYPGYPNTDSYQNGNIQPTGHRIHDISVSADVMTFCLNGCAAPQPTTTIATTTAATTTLATTTTTTTTTTTASDSPTKSPTYAPTNAPTNAPTKTPTTTTTTTTAATTTTTTAGEPYYVPAELTTTYAGGSGYHGNMFDVTCKKTLTIETFDAHCDDTGTRAIKVYTKEGSYRGFEKVSGAWTQICDDAALKCNGKNSATSIDTSKCTPIECTGERAFYITFKTNDMDYTRSGIPSEGSVYVSNDDIDIKVGTGNKYAFRRVYRPRLFNGSIKYKVAVTGPQQMPGAHVEYHTDESVGDDEK